MEITIRDAVPNDLAAIVARICGGASDAGCRFQQFSTLDGLPAREIVGRLTAPELGPEPTDDR